MKFQDVVMCVLIEQLIMYIIIDVPSAVLPSWGDQDSLAILDKKKRERDRRNAEQEALYMLEMMDANYICYRLFRSSSRPMFRFLYSGGTLSTRAPREYTEKVDGESVSQLRDAVESA
jgi:hypothetical protein